MRCTNQQVAMAWFRYFVHVLSPKKLMMIRRGFKEANSNCVSPQQTALWTISTNPHLPKFNQVSSRGFSAIAQGSPRKPIIRLIISAWNIAGQPPMVCLNNVSAWLTSLSMKIPWFLLVLLDGPAVPINPLIGITRPEDLEDWVGQWGWPSFVLQLDWGNMMRKHRKTINTERRYELRHTNRILMFINQGILNIPNFLYLTWLNYWGFWRNPDTKMSEAVVCIPLSVDCDSDIALVERDGGFIWRHPMNWAHGTIIRLPGPRLEVDGWYENSPHIRITVRILFKHPCSTSGWLEL